MKQLTILRHAKSDWGNEGLRDIDRHLNERGYSDAYLVSKWFAENQNKPDLLLSSTASRALSTALIFCREMELEDEKFELEPAIYEARVSDLKRVIGEQSDKISSLMLVGHNPGLTELCNDLSDDVFFDNVPTCGIVSIQLSGNTWADAVKGKGKVIFHYFPKDYKNQA